jgi:protoheme IX farnesyltransferase
MMDISLSRFSQVSPCPVSSEEATVQDFITLLKPGVMSLVVFTGYTGMMLAPGNLHPFLKFAALLAIALGSGGAGAINMWYDCDIDGLMKRTQKRPIPQGRIAPGDALAFGVILSLLSVLLMALSANLFAAGLLAFSIFFYVIIYTVWLKRSTPYNIVIGGAAGAFPPMIGWVATGSSLSLEPWLLFAIIFLWTPPHFWALALNRSDDYHKAHIPMLPNVAGQLETRRQILLYALFLFIVSLMPYFFHFQGMIYGITAFILGILFLALAIKIFQKGLQGDCKKLFLFSILYLFLLFMGMLVN